MTKSINNTPPNPEPERPNQAQNLLDKLKPSRKKLTWGLVAIATVGVLGYGAAQYLVRKKLPAFLETQIGNIIQRPIELGEVTKFSLGGIEFNQTKIPATSDDPDNISLEGIKVDFNIFPLIFRRTLPADITIVQPEVYLEQTADGEWVNLDFLQSSDDNQNQESSELPVKLNIGVALEDAKVTLVPYEQSPINITADGTARYNQKEGELVVYDLDAAIAKAQATFKGETVLETGQTQTKVLVKDLALADLATLLPNPPVILDSGVLNTDLDVDIPSFAEITSAKIDGLVSINDVAGEVTALSTEITAESNLNFAGNQAQITSTQASFGDIVAQVAGSVNLDSGYDLDVNVLPFRFSDLPAEIIKQIPINLGGEVAAALQLRGAIKDPLVTGKVNNTRLINIEKTKFKTIKADFTANLAEVVLDNLQVNPVAGGEITGDGIILTKIDQALQNKQTIDFNKMPLELNFNSELPTADLITPYYELPDEITVANLSAQGKVTGSINDLNALVTWQIPEEETSNTENISGSGEILLENNQLQLQNTQVNVGDGIADVKAIADLNEQNWQADINANSLALTPFLSQLEIPNVNLDRAIAVNNADIKFNGKLNELDLNKITGIANLNLDVDRGQVAVKSKLDSGVIEAVTTTDNIALQPFFELLSVPANINSGVVNISGKLEELLAFGENQKLDSFALDTVLDLEVDGNKIAVDSQLNSGIITGQVNTNEINLNKIVAALPVAAAVRSSKINFAGELQQLLNFQENSNLDRLQADIDADLDVAAGRVNVIARLNNNQFNANIDANRISSNALLNFVTRRSLTSLEFDDIYAQLDISGNINPIINNEIEVPLTIEKVAVQSGAQNFLAAGNLTFSDIFDNLDLAEANLDVNANIDFNRLPIKDLVAIASDDNQLIADSVNIAGQTKFNGEFNGKNLISAPIEPGNISLVGDLQLRNFVVNEVEFDPVMAGKVDIKLGSAIALNLKGEQDVIIAAAEPCNDSNCRLPYLPTNLEFRQGTDTEQPIIVTGRKNQNIFDLDINNFPLSLLNLAPGQVAGLQGFLKGDTTGNIAVNLDSFAANGQVKVAKPGVGYVEANQVTADFNYDPTRNLAELTTASLLLGESQYDLKASLNLQTAAIAGELNIPQAYIEDILTTFRWFTVNDLTALFALDDYSSTTEVDPEEDIYTINKAIAVQLDKLRQIEQNIQELAAAKEAGGVPTELDIKGQYTGLVTFGGTIEEPEADFKIEAKDWQWEPQPKFYNFTKAEGLVREARPIISIPQILIAGDLQGTTLDLEIAKLQLENAVFSASGNISPTAGDLKFQLADLTLATINKFIELPVDATGAINLTGQLTGSPSEPNLQGELAFVDGLFNGNSLPKQFIGNFDYDGTRLKFDTTEPSFMHLDATVPYPIIPEESDRLAAEVKLDTEAFALLDIFSNGYLKWLGGSGNADIKVAARLDLEQDIPLEDIQATGEINLDNSQVELETPLFSAPFQGTGKIILNNQIVTVESLSGTFAEKDLSVSGSLPILNVVNVENPLSVNLPPGDMHLKNLYKGGVAGNINITGAALQPVIGGEVKLEDGRVYIPKAQTTTTVNNTEKLAQNNTRRTTSDSSSTNQQNAQSSFVPELDDLKIALVDLTIRQNPLFRIDLGGDLLLNGTVDDPSNIKPEGTITLNQAWVNYLSNQFLLNRSRENTVVFTSEAGILNPYLDIVFNTLINEFDQADVRIADLGSNEINDPISQVNYRNSITVNLIINGKAAEIIPALGAKNDCDIRPDNTPLVEAKGYYTKAELDQLTTCFNIDAVAQESESVELSAVELTSIPYRSQREITSLLGNEFLSFAESLTNSSQSELFDLGVNTFVIDPLYRRAFYVVDSRVVKFGRKIGLDYLHLFPDLEGIYELDKNSSIRATYNYGIPNSQEVRLEYQLRF